MVGEVVLLRHVSNKLTKMKEEVIGCENLLNSTGEGSARTPFLVLHAHMSQVFPASHSQPWQPWGYGMTSFSSRRLVELEAVSKGREFCFENTREGEGMGGG